MEAKPAPPTSRSVDVYSVLGWLDQNRNLLIAGAVAVIVVGILVAFLVWRKGAAEVEAGTRLTALMAGAGPAGAQPDSLLEFAAEFPGTAAAARARLAGAVGLFEEGKYAEAEAEFQRFLSDYLHSPLAPQASLGRAAALEAQGKQAEAIAAYRDLGERRQAGAIAAQARFALARLYEAGGRLAEARDLYSELAGDPVSMVGSEAEARLIGLLRDHPELRAAAPAAPGAFANPLQIVPGN